jgi:hypothetical protein
MKKKLSEFGEENLLDESLEINDVETNNQILNRRKELYEGIEC